MLAVGEHHAHQFACNVVEVEAQLQAFVPQRFVELLPVGGLLPTAHGLVIELVLQFLLATQLVSVDLYLALGHIQAMLLGKQLADTCLALLLHRVTDNPAVLVDT